MEASCRERNWGCGAAKTSSRARDPNKWSGYNAYGFALMEARRILHESEPKATSPGTSDTGHVEVSLRDRHDKAIGDLLDVDPSLSLQRIWKISATCQVKDWDDTIICENGPGNPGKGLIQIDGQQRQIGIIWLPFLRHL